MAEKQNTQKQTENQTSNDLAELTLSVIPVDQLVVLCENFVDFDNLAENGFDWKPYVEIQGWTEFFNRLRGPVFPDLVKDFWVTAKVITDAKYLKVVGHVLGRPVEISEPLIGKLLGLKTGGDRVLNKNVNSPGVAKVTSSIYKKPFAEITQNNRIPKISDLKDHLRVVAKIILGCINHRNPHSSADFLNWNQRFMVYYFANGIKMNLPFLLLKSLIEEIRNSRNDKQGKKPSKKFVYHSRLISDILVENGLIEELTQMNLEEHLSPMCGKPINGATLKSMRILPKDSVFHPPESTNESAVLVNRREVQDFPLFTKLDPIDVVMDYFATEVAAGRDPGFDPLNLPDPVDLYPSKKKKVNKRSEEETKTSEKGKRPAPADSEVPSEAPSPKKFKVSESQKPEQTSITFKRPILKKKKELSTTASKAVIMEASDESESDEDGPIKPLMRKKQASQAGTSVLIQKIPPKVPKVAFIPSVLNTVSSSPSAIPAFEPPTTQLPQTTTPQDLQQTIPSEPNLSPIHQTQPIQPETMLEESNSPSLQASQKASTPQHSPSVHHQKQSPSSSSTSSSNPISPPHRTSPLKPSSSSSSEPSVEDPLHKVKKLYTDSSDSESSDFPPYLHPKPLNVKFPTPPPSKQEDQGQTEASDASMPGLDAPPSPSTIFLQNLHVIQLDLEHLFQNIIHLFPTCSDLNKYNMAWNELSDWFNYLAPTIRLSGEKIVRQRMHAKQAEIMKKFKVTQNLYDFMRSLSHIWKPEPLLALPEPPLNQNMDGDTSDSESSTPIIFEESPPKRRAPTMEKSETSKANSDIIQSLLENQRIMQEQIRRQQETEAQLAAQIQRQQESEAQLAAQLQQQQQTQAQLTELLQTLIARLPPNP